MNRSLIPGCFAYRLAGLILIAALVLPCCIQAQELRVRRRQGSLHGFLTLHDAAGAALAAGEFTQVPNGDRIKTRVVFYFGDGSIDDETTVYSQKRVLRLISDHHIQSGPSYPNPYDMTIDVPAQQVSVRALAQGKEEQRTEHMDLPPELANGILFNVIVNLRANTPKIEVPYVSSSLKPRMVKLAIGVDGNQQFKVGGHRYKAIKYDVKVEIGGIAGVVAPMIGKQPPDTYVWITEGSAPTILRIDGALYTDGPIWSIQLASPVW